MSETVTMTLTEFLLARIAEDEAAARGARSASGKGPWSAATYRVVVDDGAFEVAEAAVPTAAHMARHDPARVLAECEAKRRIVALYTGIQDHPEDWSQEEWAGANAIAEGCLRALALLFADHPDYDEAWAA